MAWMPTLLSSRNDLHYTGMDIVKDLIDLHTNKYADKSQRQFILGDALNNNVTIGEFDLIFSRHMMQHLYSFDVARLLIKLSESGSKFILMTTHMHVTNKKSSESEVTRKRYRPLNLQVSFFLTY